MSSKTISDAGENTPRCEIPCVAGIQQSNINPDHKMSKKYRDGQCYLYGDGALDPKLVSSRIYPVENGIIRDWETMGDIFEYGFQTLLDSNQNKVSTNTFSFLNFTLLH